MWAYVGPAAGFILVSYFRIVHVLDRPFSLGVFWSAEGGGEGSIEKFVQFCLYFVSIRVTVDDVLSFNRFCNI